MKAGKYVGLSIQCPLCEERPPKNLKGAQRWRYLASHMATAHGRKLKLVK